jgi:hypothetical protein
VIVTDSGTRRDLAGWLRTRGKERRETIWFRDAEVAEAVQAILFIGLAPNWYPPNYDCGACGYATCAEFLNATSAQRKASAELEFAGPTCNLRDIDTVSRSDPRRRPPRYIRSIAAVRPGLRSRPASSVSSAPRSRSRCRCR